MVSGGGGEVGRWGGEEVTFTVHYSILPASGHYSILTILLQELPTGKTSCTSCRDVRIDALLYQVS